MVQLYDDFTSIKYTKGQIEEKYGKDLLSLSNALKYSIRRRTEKNKQFTTQQVKRKNIREFLNYNRMTITQCAKSAGISVVTLKRFLHGAGMRKNNLEKLSKYTKMSYKALMELDTD